jgi:uncharacterized protein (TIGR03437 family)
VLKTANILAGLAVSLARNGSPVTSLHSILNAASFYAPRLPVSIAQGSVFTIFGSSDQQLVRSRFRSRYSPFWLVFPIPVSQGTTTVNAFPLFVVQSQVNALMPSSDALGWASLRLTFNDVSNPSPVYSKQSGSLH